MPQEVRIYTFKLPKEYWSIGDKLEELANLEKVSISEIIRAAIEEYVKKHKDGNPQKPLFPTNKPWEIPVVERRRENLEWIESLVERNAGKMTQLQLMAQFSSVSGLKMETVKEYIQTLLLAKRLKVQGGKVYHRNNLST